MTETLIDRVIWRQTWLAKVAVPVQGAAGPVYGTLGGPGRTLKNLMHGPSGHPFHPASSDLPIGAWGAGVVADYVAHHLVFGIGTMVNRKGFAEGPEQYVAVGVAADFPTANCAG